MKSRQFRIKLVYSKFCFIFLNFILEGAPIWLLLKCHMKWEEVIWSLGCHPTKLISTTCPPSYMVLHTVMRLNVCVSTLSPHFFYSTIHCHILSVLTSPLLFHSSQCHTFLAKGEDHLASFSLWGYIGNVSAFIPSTYTLNITTVYNPYCLSTSLDTVSPLWSSLVFLVSYLENESVITSLSKFQNKGLLFVSPPTWTLRPTPTSTCSDTLPYFSISKRQEKKILIS